MRNLFSILIFFSLAIAIGVIGRHLPEIKVYFQKKKKTSWRNFRIAGWFANIGKRIGQFFLFLAEAVVKKFKNLLHLTHFWLIKLRKKRQKNEGLREIEAKMELLEEEEKTLEKVISEDLGQEEEDFLTEKFKKKALFEKNDSAGEQSDDYLKIQEKEEIEIDQDVEIFRQEKISLTKKDFSLEEKTEEKEIVLTKEPTSIPSREDYNDGRDEKISRFFSEDQDRQEETLLEKEEQSDFSDDMVKDSDWKQNKDEVFSQEDLLEQQEEVAGSEKENDKKKSFFSRLTDRFKLESFKKKPEWENDFPAEEKYQEEKSEKEDFSDGIVKVGELAIDSKERDYYQQENNLIKEVVRVAKKKEEYSDEDLGVDREILERKIISKISLNPRDQENYRQLGDLYLKMENFRDAEECYRQVLKLRPRDLAAKRKLERVRLLKRLHQK